MIMVRWWWFWCEDDDNNDHDDDGNYVDNVNGNITLTIFICYLSLNISQC